MAKFLLTPQALADLDAVAEYTLGRWGRQQVKIYLTALTDRMEWLAESPDLGKSRDEIAPGYRSFPEGSHLIFYIPEDGHISIIGVPHQSMDVDKHFGE